MKTRRPNRPARSRRQQYRRSQARNVQELLRVMVSLDHRGCRRSQLGESLFKVLQEGGCRAGGGLLAKAEVRGQAEEKEAVVLHHMEGKEKDAHSIHEKLNVLTDEFGALQKPMEKAKELLTAVKQEAAADTQAAEEVAKADVAAEVPAQGAGVPAEGAGVPGNSLTAAVSDTKEATVAAAGYSAAEAQMHQEYITHFLKNWRTPVKPE